MLQIAPQYQPVFRELGIDAEGVFDHPQIRAWRRLDDRENCTLDAKLVDGRNIRWHIKRYPAMRKSPTPAQREVRGFELLRDADIPAAKLVGWGELGDGRSFVVTEDLAGYQPADKLLASGFRFDRLRDSLADLTAKLHRAGLHHRDLYLCHFFVKTDESQIDVKLIDVARVKKLPALLGHQRWIIKDLAQFWYSTLALAITEVQRDMWLRQYVQGHGEGQISSLRRSIERKVARISRHDAKLRRAQPGRNISIPPTF